MNSIIGNFLEITKIKRCSFDTKKMQEFLVNFAKDLNYKVLSDSCGNILISKGKPKICLQAHYDMVCVGDAPKIEIIQDKNILKAKNSSLGADNGIAIAMMMELMKEGANLEFLLTNDEEVGLIGAKNLELTIESKYLLNLDSEDEAQVYIGCAGGADIVANFKDELIEVEEGSFYEILVSNLPGGHSGVDIDKEIPSAIKLLIEYLNSNKIDYFSLIEGGERRNSIPVNAKAIIKCNKDLISTNNVSVKRIDSNLKVFKNSKKILELLDKLPHGVIDYNKEFNVPQTSANLAQISTTNNNLEIAVTPRAMSNDSLNSIIADITKLFKEYNFNTKIEDEYPAWKPEVNEFTKLVKDGLNAVFGKSDIKVIHAGLECGLLSEKLKGVKFASIGPNIKFPHSKREFVEIDSVDKTYKALKLIISRK